MPDQLQELANLANPSRSQDYAPPQAIEPPQQQFNGWEGTTGKVAGLAGNFLSGLSRGRSMAFARSEQQKANAEKSLLSAMQAVSQSQLPDSLKQEQSVELQRMFGNVILGQIEGSQPKGKKGGGQSSGDGQDQQHPGHHVLGAIKGILEGALGPGRQKQAYTPEEIKAKTDGVFQTLGNYQNSVQSKVTEADKGLQQIYGKLYHPDGTPPTQDELNKSPEYQRSVGAALAVNNGNPTPFISQIASAQKERQETAKEESKSNLELKKQELVIDKQQQHDDAVAKLQDVKDKAAQVREESREKARSDLDAPLRRAQIAKDYAEANLARIKAKAETEGTAASAVTSTIAAKVMATPPQADGTHPEALQGVDPKIGTLVKMLTEYKFPANSYALRAAGKGKDPAFLSALELAPLYDPSFDAKEYGKRQKVIESFASGMDAKNITSLNTVVHHLQTFKEKADALDNTRFPSANSFKNFLASSTGQGKVKAFNGAADAVYNEMATVFKGTGATDQEIKAWRNTIKESDSPEQFQEQFNVFFRLIGGRISALQDKYVAGMGKSKINGILSPRSHKILTEMGVNANEIDPATDQQAVTDTPPAGQKQGPPGGQQQAAAPPSGGAGAAPPPAKVEHPPQQYGGFQYDWDEGMQKYKRGKKVS